MWLAAGVIIGVHLMVESIRNLIRNTVDDYPLYCVGVLTLLGAVVGFWIAYKVIPWT